MKKLFITVFVLFVGANLVYGAPNNTMSITPLAVHDNVDEAADENARNNIVSTTYNAHTHLGLLAENTLVVGSTNAEYSTIDAAINAASAGDVILVNEGTYTETITYDVDNLTIRSVGSPENTIITRVADTAVNFSTKSGCVLDGFTISITAADASADTCIKSANDAVTLSSNSHNIVENCIIDWDATVENPTGIAIHITDGDFILRNNRIYVTNTYAGTNLSGMLGFYTVTGAGHDYQIYNNIIDIDNSGTGTANTTSAIYIAVGTTTDIRGNTITVDNAGKTTAVGQGIYSAATNTYFMDNILDIDASDTGTMTAITGTTNTLYVISNFIDATTGDSDATWITGGTTSYITGNVVTGDCVYSAATTAYAMANSINGDLINGGGTKISNATEAGAMFWDGIVIGTDNDNNILDDATHGAGVGTLYLGNATVDATFTGFHYYELGDTNLQMGELVKLVDGKLYRSDIAQDPTVIGLYCGLSNWKDSLGNTLIDGKVVDKEYNEWDDIEKKHVKKTKKIKDYSQPINIKTNKPITSADFSRSVAIVGDSMHENETNPLEGAWVTVSAGTIKNGDLLCSSNKAGYLEKQSDDILHSYTIAQAREDISKDTKKGYIYLLQ